MDKAGDILKKILTKVQVQECEKYSGFFRNWSKIAGEEIAFH